MTRTSLKTIEVPDGLEWLVSSHGDGPKVAFGANGLIYFRKDASSEVLVFNREEWRAFLLGVEGGEFNHPNSAGPPD
jgi:hypothetical protein